ncbi:unnamed protein product [Prorocentrum cordatum]|uniref:Pentatricopeptide repeat-containing protein n=1 Tax=Prorocentrum cordatum TaxID=2364126 RepID=A0ABN9S6K6_9DINO|nr:unnamed protein product [Polarella glacialis]
MLDGQLEYSRGASSLKATIRNHGRQTQWIEALRLFRDACQSRAKESHSLYIDIVSACGKGRQWQQYLSLVDEMVELKLELNVIICSTGISVCRKGGRWKEALSLFSEVLGTNLEPDSNLQRRHQCVREGWELDVGAVVVQ